MRRFWPMGLLAFLALGTIGCAFPLTGHPTPPLMDHLGIQWGQPRLYWLFTLFVTCLLILSGYSVLIASHHRRSAPAYKAGDELVVTELANTASLLRTIVSSTPGLIYAKDLDGRFLLVNPAVAALTGKPWSDSIGRTDAELLHDVAQGHAIMHNDRRIVQSGASETFEEEVSTPDGQPRFWLSTKAPLRDMNGDVGGVVGISVDITDYKAAAAKLEILQNELAHMGRLNAMGELSLALAHELSQPLATVVNHLAIAEHAIAQHIATVDPGIARRLADATEQAMRAGTILKRLQTFVESDQPDKKPENVADLVTEAVALVSGAVRRRGMSIVTHIADRQARILADRVQIQQVVINLIRNASDAMENLPLAHREVLVTARSTDDRKAQIMVEDQGPGMSSEERRELFQRFSTTRYRESGLGIPISLRIIEAHGGELIYDQGKNGGAKLTATLPMV